MGNYIDAYCMGDIGMSYKRQLLENMVLDIEELAKANEKSREEIKRLTGFIKQENENIKERCQMQGEIEDLLKEMGGE